jgi:hypothetical protein
MNDLSPTQRFPIILDILSCWKVMFVLLHGNDTRRIEQGYNVETKVCSVLDSSTFAEEGSKVRCKDIVDMGHESGWGQL